MAFKVLSPYGTRDFDPERLAELIPRLRKWIALCERSLVTGQRITEDRPMTARGMKRRETELAELRAALAEATKRLKEPAERRSKGNVPRGEHSKTLAELGLTRKHHYDAGDIAAAGWSIAPRHGGRAGSWPRKEKPVLARGQRFCTDARRPPPAKRTRGQGANVIDLLTWARQRVGR